MLTCLCVHCAHPEYPSEVEMKKKLPIKQVPEHLRHLGKRAMTDVQNTRIEKATVDTGRTLRALRGWDLWAILREFIQNMVDHLQLIDPNTGFRRAGLQVELRGTKLLITSRGIRLCTIKVMDANHLSIEQHYTAPMSRRALETGITDLEKHASGNAMAGGYGDGFKSAAQALLAKHGELTWTFEGAPQRVKWVFSGEERAQESTFQKARVMVVNITTRKTKKQAAPLDPQKMVMRQEMTCEGIGTTFLKQVLRRFVVFWNAVPDASPHMLRSGTTLLAPQAHLLAGPGGERPEPGLFTKGIWVKAPPIPGTVLCSMRLNVSSRDRNDVHQGKMKDEFVSLFRGCDQGHLRELLQPLLKGKADDKADDREGNWLMQDFIQHELVGWAPQLFRKILGVQEDMLFVHGLEQGSPLMQWVGRLLLQRGKVLEIGATAHWDLFPRASDNELKDQVAHLLEEDAKEREQSVTGHCIEDMVGFCLKEPQMDVRVMLSPLCEEPFVWRNHLFAPWNMELDLIAVVQLGTLLASKPGIFDMRKVCALQRQACQQPSFSPQDIKHMIQEAQRYVTDAPPKAAALPAHAPPVPLCKRVLDTVEGPPGQAPAHYLQASDGPLARKRALDTMEGPQGQPPSSKRAHTSPSAPGFPCSYKAAPLESFDLSSSPQVCAPTLEDEGHLRHSDLNRFHVGEDLGGDVLLCSPEVHLADLPSDVKEDIVRSRRIMRKCLTLLKSKVPEVQPEMVYHAYDPSGGYRGFCLTKKDGCALIVLNVAALLHVSEFGIMSTLTHEVAHLVEEHGHGAMFRTRWLELLEKVWGGWSGEI